MQLKRLLSQVPAEVVLDARGDVEITSLEYDSRRVSPGALFFAVRGLKADGHDFIDQARQKGAKAVASERPPTSGIGLAWIQCTEIRRAMAALADAFYNGRSPRIPLVGITGTNGKTTTAFLVHSILNRSVPCLMTGTVTTAFGARQQKSGLTTPESIDIQRTLASARQAGCRWGTIEVSSHALVQHRVDFCHFPVAVFTNLSRDHLDYHGDFESYFAAKRRLFEPEANPGLQCAVANHDDPYGVRIKPKQGQELIRFGRSPRFEVHPLKFETGLRGSRIRLSLKGRILDLETTLAGEHNLDNVMAAVAASDAMGACDEDIRMGIRSLSAVPGRFEPVDSAHPAGVVLDFAHTPHALENVLRLCRGFNRQRLICVFGCGGERDREKRPLMGRIAVDLADYVIVTSDNPRGEPPDEIVAEIVAGIPPRRTNFETIVDRRQAIRRALELAQKGDIVLLAGKGHETEQEIAGRRFPFDERQVVREVAQS